MTKKTKQNTFDILSIPKNRSKEMLEQGAHITASYGWEKWDIDEICDELNIVPAQITDYNVKWNTLYLEYWADGELKDSEGHCGDDQLTKHPIEIEVEYE